MSGGSVRYVLDANVFIEAARRYYAFDIAPRFWEALCQHGQAGVILSIDRVKGEIDRNKDELTDWADGSFHAWFAPTDDEDVINAYRETMQWSNGQRQYTEAAKAEFAREENADAWLVAYARAKNCVLVTHEQFARDARARIPLPNVCQAFSVQYIDPFQMLRALGIRLG